MSINLLSVFMRSFAYSFPRKLKFEVVPNYRLQFIKRRNAGNGLKWGKRESRPKNDHALIWKTKLPLQTQTLRKLPAHVEVISSGPASIDAFSDSAVRCR